jgi:hypothetical protein
MPGLDANESALEVRRDDRLTLIVNDAIGNVRHPPGLGAQIMARLFGFGVNHPQVPRTFARYVKDKHAVAAQLRAWAAMDRLLRVVPSHGDIIADDPASALRRLADDLIG